MKPLYIKKNGQVEKVTGAFAMPASYPAERVAYDNTNSGLSADDAQGAIDEIVEEVNDKVDKETGKGLSANDYTTTEKNKLEGISANANKVESSTTNGNIKIDSVETPVYRNYGNNAVLTTDKTPFLTRQTLNPTGFSGYVREKLIGASYAWNQLITDGNFTNSTKWECSNGTFTISGNVATITCTIAGNVTFNPSSSIETIANHKYIACVSIESTSGKEIQLSTAYSGTEPTTTSNKRLAFIGYRSSSLSAKYPRIIGKNMAVGEQYKVKCFILSDLTLAFGSTIADYLYSLANNGGITKLRDMGCPIDKYTAYGYGLYSVKTSGKKITFKNLVDYKDFVIGSISGTGEDNNISTIRLRSPFIRVAPNTTYAFSTGNSLYVFEIHEYVAEGNWIKYTAINATSGTLTVSANTNLVKVLVRKQDNSAIYVNDNPTFQMEKGLQATAYTPYAPITYPLGNDELRGKFDLVNGEIVASGDVKESNGNIGRNYNIVDLGIKDWSYHASTSSTDTSRFSLAAGSQYLPDAEVPNLNNVANVVCARYVASSNSQNVNGGSTRTGYISVTTGGNIVITDTRYTTATDLKTALNGVYLIYKKASVTTEQSTPFADPMSMVGATTEEYIDNRDIPCPVGAERQYMGQSEDVVEIPSSPLSDGKRKLVAETSGGKTQYYFEDDKNGAGTQVNLMTYNTSTNKYVCPSDGYISLSNAGASVGDYVIMSVYGANDNLICGLRCDTSVASIVTVQNLFVKRGMKCYVRATSSTGSFTALFTPLA